MNREEYITAVSERLQKGVLTPMKQQFIGKDEIIDLLGVCVAARENLFLHGPPGTAKSALVQTFSKLIQGQNFDYLLSRFTEPNELFGPFDISKLREGELVTNTEGMLPEADIIFLDELLNANSAILNSLLMALNERIFRRGRETRDIPALFFVGASNHLPEDENLQALFDRFLLRVRCDAVPDEQLEAVLNAGWNLEQTTEAKQSGLSAAHIRDFQKQVPSIDLTTPRNAYIDLVIKLRNAGIAISDRRAVRLQRLVAASAMVSGRTSARISDLWVFRHIWERQEQIEIIESIVAAVLKQTKSDGADHPQAFTNPPPDPEIILNSLEKLNHKIQPGSTEPMLADELRALSDRIEWIPVGPARQSLEQKRDELWAKIDSATTT